MFFIPHGFGHHSAQIFNQLSRLTNQGTVIRVASSNPPCPKSEQTSAFPDLLALVPYSGSASAKCHAQEKRIKDVPQLARSVA